MSEAKRNVPMARPSETSDGAGQGHTIVGGRPAGTTDRGRGIPRGMELLIKRAAVDASFRADLLSRRAAVADELAIPLDPSERAMLTSIPEAQLGIIISGTAVPEPQRKALTGASAAAMLALLAQLTFTPVAGRADTPPVDETSGELRPGLPNAGVSASDDDDRMTRGIRPDFPMPPGGARPDIPRPPKPVPAPPITPDETEIRVAPIPATSTWKAGDPLTFNVLQEVLVKDDVTNRPFSDALDLLAADTGIRISLAGGTAIDTSRRVSATTAGLPLGKALRKVCTEAAGDAALFVIDIEESQIVVRFRSRTGEARPGIQTTPPVDIDDSAITRGIRPDIPGLDE